MFVICRLNWDTLDSRPLHDIYSQQREASKKKKKQKLRHNTEMILFAMEAIQPAVQLFKMQQTHSIWLRFQWFSYDSKHSCAHTYSTSSQYINVFVWHFFSSSSFSYSYAGGAFTHMLLARRPRLHQQYATYKLLSYTENRIVVSSSCPGASCTMHNAHVRKYNLIYYRRSLSDSSTNNNT